MADTYTGKKITEITENTSGDDTDLLVVGNRGTAVMRRLTLANLATYIRDKLASLTFSALNTSSKTLPGAINELNNNKLLITNIISGSISMSAGVRANYNIPYTMPTGYNVIGAWVMYTPNAAWVLANISAVGPNAIQVGAYNAASSTVTGTFQLVAVFRKS